MCITQKKVDGGNSIDGGNIRSRLHLDVNWVDVDGELGHGRRVGEPEGDRDGMAPRRAALGGGLVPLV